MEADRCRIKAPKKEPLSGSMLAEASFHGKRLGFQRLRKATGCELRAISVSGYAPGTKTFFSRQGFQSVQPSGDIVRITRCAGEFGELQGMVRQTRL